MRENQCSRGTNVRLHLRLMFRTIRSRPQLRLRRGNVCKCWAVVWGKWGRKAKERDKVIIYSENYSETLAPSTTEPHLSSIRSPPEWERELRPFLPFVPLESSWAMDSSCDCNGLRAGQWTGKVVDEFMFLHHHHHHHHHQPLVGWLARCWVARVPASCCTNPS